MLLIDLFTYFSQLYRVKIEETFKVKVSFYGEI